MEPKVRAFLRKARKRMGLRRKPPRSSMARGLKWLADRGFMVETVLDIGASSGVWSKECANFFPEAQYVLFEPQPVHSEALTRFAGSCRQRVIIVEKAAGAVEGRTYFLTDPEDPLGGALASVVSENAITVDVTTVDASVTQFGLSAPFLVKLDTHGYEKSILDGAGDTLEKTEVLIIEAYNYRISDEAMLFWELCSYMSERGFRPIDLVDIGYRKYDNSLWQMDLFFIRSGWEGFAYHGYR